MRAPVIEGYRFGRLVVDGRLWRDDLLILPDGGPAAWRRHHGHLIEPDDLGAVFAAAPDVLVVGCGRFRRVRVSERTRQALTSAGIDLIAEPTHRALRTYQRLRSEQRVAAVLHLSC